MTGVLLVYILGAIGMFAMGALEVSHNERGTQRRQFGWALACLSPAWPLALIGYGILYLAASIMTGPLSGNDKSTPPTRR